jgi:hypothetical protein
MQGQSARDQRVRQDKLYASCEAWTSVIGGFKSANSSLENRLAYKRAADSALYIGLPPREARRFALALQVVFSRPQGCA